MPALGLALLLLATSAMAESFDPAERVRETVLENGLRVLTLEDHTTPVVSFQIWVDVGSGDESRYTGLAHLFEHMMFRGSERVSGEQRDRLLKERGARENAYTSRDVTVYFEDVAAEHLPLVIELEAERFRNLIVSAEILDTEREVVLEERRMRTEDNPRGRLLETVMALAWQAHPYRVPTIGWRSDVETVPVEVCREFFDAFYAPNNLTISVVGAFDSEATLAAIRTHFGPLEAAEEIPRNPTLEPEQDGERRAVVHFPVVGPLVASAWQAPATGHADAHAVDVASEILSTGLTSRLHRRLVYEEQKALYAYGGYWELRRSGLFYAAAGVRPGGDVDEVEALLLEEIGRLALEPVSDAELDKAKRSLEVRLINGLGTSHALASHIANETLSFGRIRTLDERLESIRAVSAADVQRVVDTYLRPEKRNVVQLVAPPAAPPAGEAAAAAGAGK